MIMLQLFSDGQDQSKHGNGPGIIIFMILPFCMGIIEDVDWCYQYCYITSGYDVGLNISLSCH